MRSLQEIFDEVAIHLLTQGATSERNGTCLYRSPSGLKCAAGFLIPDELYSPDFEENCWIDLAQSEGAGSLLASAVPAVAPLREYLAAQGLQVPEAVALVSELQTVHDVHEAEEWPDRLRDVAGLYKLSTEKINRWEIEKENARA